MYKFCVTARKLNCFRKRHSIYYCYNLVNIQICFNRFLCMSDNTGCYLLICRIFNDHLQQNINYCLMGVDVTSACTCNYMYSQLGSLAPSFLCLVRLMNHSSFHQYNNPTLIYNADIVLLTVLSLKFLSRYEMLIFVSERENPSLQRH